MLRNIKPGHNPKLLERDILLLLSRYQRAPKGTSYRFGAIFVILSIPCSILAILAIGAIIWLSAAPELDSLEVREVGQLGQVFASDGQTRLGFLAGEEIHQPLEYKELPKLLKQGTVAVEDQDFWNHSGVDVRGIIRAGVADIQAGSVVQGGSTITMQLARALYANNDQTLSRKLEELRLATQLERDNNKPWILTKYLNTIPYGTLNGQSALGVQAASRLFFNRSVSKLTRSQTALLVGLPQAPTDYNPIAHPKAARARRHQVLLRWLDEGIITREDFNKIDSSKLSTIASDRFKDRRQDYFFDYVQRQLIERYGKNRVLNGGIRATTTLDLDLQHKASDALATHTYKGGPSAALIAIDPRNGQIKAMASSSDYDDNQFNYATQGQRQPGSTFKTFALVGALMQGYDPDGTVFNSGPLTIPLPDGTTWEVNNFSGGSAGALTMREATLQSDNTYYAQLAGEIGYQNVKRTAKLMGIESKLYGRPAEVLGGLEEGVTPLEMTAAYATIASGGIRHKPTSIKQVDFIRDKHHSAPKRWSESKRALKPSVAALAADVLRDNVTSGTGQTADPGCFAAGKTGTTSSYKDAWFVGWSDTLAVGVWLGYPEPKSMYDPVSGQPMVGGLTPSRIWHDFVSTAEPSCL